MNKELTNADKRAAMNWALKKIQITPGTGLDEAFLAGCSYKEQTLAAKVEALERLREPLELLTNSALAGLKPLPSQVDLAFYALKSLEGKEGEKK